MPIRKLKYQKYLDELPNCPPNYYKELSENAFRWVFGNRISDSFVPLNRVKEPPQRMLDDTDLMCKGFGLSFFDSFAHAFNRYEALYKRKRGLSHKAFILEKGDSIAELEMTENEGIFGDINVENGHFTFHEFDETDLSKNILFLEDYLRKMENLKGKIVAHQEFQNLLIRVADVVNMDGPLLTLFLHANRQLYLLDWVDRDAQSNRWLIYRTNKVLLNRFLNRDISHYQLLMSDESYVFKIDIDNKLDWNNCLQVPKKSLPNSYLPSKDVFFEKSDCPNFPRLSAFLNPVKNSSKRPIQEVALATSI